MAFKATNVIPEGAYRRAKQVAVGAQSVAAARSSSWALPFTNADAILSTYHRFRQVRIDLLEVASTPGIAQYAKDVELDQAYDVVSEFTALVAAINAVLTEIEATFPTNAAGYLLEKRLVNGVYEFRVFSAASLAPLRGLLDAVVAAVA